MRLAIPSNARWIFPIIGVKKVWPGAPWAEWDGRVAFLYQPTRYLGRARSRRKA